MMAAAPATACRQGFLVEPLLRRLITSSAFARDQIGRAPARLTERLERAAPASATALLSHLFS